MNPQHANDYTDPEIQAVTSVLLELGQLLGAYREKIVLIGGGVPSLLFQGHFPSHVGTLDIDLNLDPDALGEGEYANLIELLEAGGYERGEPLKPFQLRRWVHLPEQVSAPIPVIIDLLMPRAASPKKNRPPLVEGLRVQAADGAEFALRYSVLHTIDDRMPDGTRNQVQLLVSSIPALMVMKGHALTKRIKQKDAYDIYYSVKHYGFEALAQACMPLLEEPGAREAYQLIAGKFRFEDDYGPVTVRRFLEEARALGDLSPEQVQVDAYRQVRAWLEFLGFSFP